jgi:putative methyltransferase (TIGR04325 family)
MRATLKECVPPILLRMIRPLIRRGIRFEGNFADWKSAQSASGGYDHDDIVQRVFDAETKVRRGEAADERDSVLFDAVQFSLPVMAALARIATIRRTPLRVLDFGGAFGGMYRQYRAFGLPVPACWNVVEQAGFVGRSRTFETAELRFHLRIEDALSEGLPDVALFSSVLQYLERPNDILEKINAAGVAHVVIDRTPCHAGERDLLAVQHVPAEIYRASYPCWIFSRSRLLRTMKDFKVIASFEDANGPWQGPGTKFDLSGFILDRLG